MGNGNECKGYAKDVGMNKAGLLNFQTSSAPVLLEDVLLSFPWNKMKF